jgi:hypothetical protein
MRVAMMGGIRRVDGVERGGGTRYEEDGECKYMRYENGKKRMEEEIW